MDKTFDVFNISPLIAFTLKYYRKDHKDQSFLDIELYDKIFCFRINQLSRFLI